MNRRYLLDLVERVGFTYVQTYLGLWIASGLGMQYLTDLSGLDKAGVACLPAALAAVKGLSARLVGSRNTAAILPASEDTPKAANG